jgi:hypothetical protein
MPVAGSARPGRHATVQGCPPASSHPSQSGNGPTPHHRYAPRQLRAAPGTGDSPASSCRSHSGRRPRESAAATADRRPRRAASGPRRQVAPPAKDQQPAHPARVTSPSPYPSVPMATLARPFGPRDGSPARKVASKSARTRSSGTLACFASRPARRLADRPGYWSWLRVALVVVAVAQRRLGPNSSATTSTTDRALPSSAVHARCWSRPTTTTRLPLFSDSMACSAWSRHRPMLGLR